MFEEPDNYRRAKMPIGHNDDQKAKIAPMTYWIAKKCSEGAEVSGCKKCSKDRTLIE